MSTAEKLFASGTEPKNAAVFLEDAFFPHEVDDLAENCSV